MVLPRGPRAARAAGSLWRFAGNCYTSARMASCRSWVRIVLLAAALAAFAAALAVPGLETGVLFLSPAIVVLALLLGGHYVGEQQLGRLAAAWRQRRPRRGRVERSPLPRRPRALMPRGGRLVATSLAVRPPPLLHAVR
jgi:hypothetical protein